MTQAKQSIPALYDFIKERHAKHCYQCDPAYGEGVAKALGMNIDFSDVK